MDKPSSTFNLASPKLTLNCDNITHKSSEPSPNHIVLKSPRGSVQGSRLYRKPMVRKNNQITTPPILQKDKKRNISTNTIRLIGRLYRVLGKIRKKLNFTRLDLLTPFQVSIINDYTYNQEIQAEIKKKQIVSSPRVSFIYKDIIR